MAGASPFATAFFHPLDPSLGLLQKAKSLFSSYLHRVAIDAEKRKKMSREKSSVLRNL